MSYIHPSAIIHPGCIIEPGVYIGPCCVIGAPSEITGYTGAQYGVIIRTGARLEGLISVDAGSHRPTEIKAAHIMKHAHVGHDAIIMDGVVMSPGAVVGGHSVVYDKAVMGIRSAIHQNHALAPGAMLGMGCVLPKAKVTEPFAIYIGSGQRLRENSKLLNSLTIDEVIALVAKWESR